MRKVVPSVLTNDPKELERKIRILEQLTDTIQIDIMDGELVPNTSIKANDVRKINTSAKLEMHLMVRNPIEYIEPYADTIAFRIIFHIESDDNPEDLINEIVKSKMKPGIAINPPTPVERIMPYLDMIDIALVMGVNPGFQGQKFIPDVLSKVRKIKNKRQELLIEVDGGVNPETVPDLISSGVDILNVGSYLFKDDNVENNWKQMQHIINQSSS